MAYGSLIPAMYMHVSKLTIRAHVVVVSLDGLSEMPIAYTAIGTSITWGHISIGGLGDLANFTKYHNGLSSMIPSRLCCIIFGVRVEYSPIV